MITGFQAIGVVEHSELASIFLAKALDRPDYAPALASALMAIDYGLYQEWSKVLEVEQAKQSQVLPFVLHHQIEG